VARRLSAPVLLAAAYGLLLLAWVVTNPPGASPDEPAHLVRARATARGQWVGTPATYAPTPEFGARELPWINRATRAFDVDPTTVFPTIATCNAFHPEVSSRCLDESLRATRGPAPPRSYVGTYQPFAYVPAGLAANRFSDPRTGIIAGRLVFGFLVAALLALAIAALWDRGEGAWPLLGVLVAVSPAVLFAGASMSPSGVEIAGSIATFAVVLRLGSGQDNRSRWWLALGLTGVTVVLSRPLGPMWVLAAFVGGPALSTPAAARSSFRRGGRAALASLGVITAAIAVSITWGLVLSPTPPRPTHVASDILRAGAQLPEVLREMIGVFGWLDTGMPAAAYATWRMMVVALVVVALLVAPRRARRLLVAAVSGVVVITVLMALFVTFPTGFDLQGRYVLPLAAGVPLLAGEIVRRNRAVLGAAMPRRLPVLAAFAAAIVQVVAWYSNARRHAVGVRGPLVFFGRGEWSPVGGWSMWAVVVVVAATLVVMAAIAAQSSSSSVAVRAAPSNG
jgi:hypothetical protein